MSIFQAYCCSVDDDGSWRLVLTFPDSSVADEWWRAISGVSTISSSLGRINPRFYTHTPTKYNLYNFFMDYRTKTISARFLGRFFITLIDDRAGRNIPIVNNLPYVANAISGNGFFIHSIANPAFYWFYDQTNGTKRSISASVTQRTRFLIAAVDADNAGKVLINTDLVTLQLEYSKQYINVNGARDLFIDNTPHQFLFGDLTKNIGYNQFYGLLKDESGDSSGTNGSGWAWELAE